MRLLVPRRGDAAWTAAGMLVLSITAIMVARGEWAVPPFGVLLVPPLVVAAGGGPRATAAVGAAAVLLGAAMAVFWHVGLTTGVVVRLGAVALGIGLAVLISILRAGHERTIAQQQAVLALTRARSEADGIRARMLDRLPELALGTDVRSVAALACDVAVDLFTCDAASFWIVEDERCVLLAAHSPWGDRVGLEVPRESMLVDPTTNETPTASWQDRAGVLAGMAGHLALSDGRAAVGTTSPIRVEGRTRAYLCLTWTQARQRPGREWVDVLDRFADQVALAKTVARRRLAQAETQQLALRLQAGLLPSLQPPGGPVEVETVYRPGSQRLLLGGDFLDARRDGDQVNFIIGDVSGHGPEQAALATILRAAWLTVLDEPGSAPDTWLRALDRVLHQARPSPDLLVTALVGCVDPDPCDPHIEYVSAGHPPPLLMTTSTAHLPLGLPPLGVAPLPERLLPQRIPLPAEWTLLVVTDGVYEGRWNGPDSPRGTFDEFASLVAQRHDRPHDNPGYLADLVAEMERRNGGPLPDDVAAMRLTRRDCDGTTARRRP